MQSNNAARFDFPQGVAVDPGTNLYVADTYNNAIRKVTPSGTNWVVTTIAGAPMVEAVDRDDALDDND